MHCVESAMGKEYPVPNPFIYQLKQVKEVFPTHEWLITTQSSYSLEMLGKNTRKAILNVQSR